MNRRDFLKIVGATAIGIVAIPFIKPVQAISKSFTNRVQTFVETNRLTFNENERPYGISWSEWVRKWWTWASGFSMDSLPSPFTDVTGEETMKGQPSIQEVFFLSGSYLASTHRTITIPKEKAIFFPILNCCDKVGDIFHKQGVAYTLDSDKKTKEFTIGEINEAKSVEVTLDGNGLPYHRINSNTMFEVESKKYQLWEIEGKVRMFADGYWCFLKPLPAGRYQLYHKGVGTPWWDNEWHDINYFTEARDTLIII